MVKLKHISFSITFCTLLCNEFVDFDKSLGKFESYYARAFTELNNTHSLTNYWNILTKPYQANHAYKVCKNLYLNNIGKTKNDDNTTRIPLYIHQIWLGSSLPKKYEKWQRTWQNIPGWSYKLWTDKDLKNIKLINQSMFDNEKNYAAKADILRVEILNMYGGLYVDTDFECLRPNEFTKLAQCYDFFAGLHPLDCKAFGLVNAIIGSIPNHPILLGYIDELSKQNKNERNIVVKTGPGLFTKAFLKYHHSKTDIIFPPSFFYPLGVNQKFKNLNNQQIIKIVVKPETLAIHWWEGSWK